MEKKKINKSIVFSIVAVILLIAVVIGATYAYFSAQESTDIQTVTTGNLAMNFTNGDMVNGDKILPINDVDIKTKASSLDFSVTNTGSEHMNLTIKLTEIAMSDELKDIDFRWGLYNKDTNVGLSFGTFKGLNETEVILLRDTIIDAAEPDITKNYTLRVWIHDDGAEQNYMKGKSFSARVTVSGETIEYTDESCFTMEGSNIREYSETCPSDVVIPKTINGVKVTGIARYAEVDDNYEVIESTDIFPSHVTSLIIPDTVTTIESIGNEDQEQICNGCTIKHITIPESVESVASLFDLGLETVFISENTSISGDSWSDRGAFTGNKLTSIVISTDANDNIFSGNPLESIVLMDGVKYIGKDAFAYAEKGEIEIPASVTSIGEYALNSSFQKLIIRGKTSLDEFKDKTAFDYIPEFYPDMIIEFRP